jgi:hypothetical protein
MAYVLSKDGAATAEDFHSTTGTPIVIDVVGEAAYALNSLGEVFQIGGGSGATGWGGITGTLSTQTDLQTALNGKQASGNYATGGGTAVGENTGDNATNTQYSGLSASKQDVLVSAENIKTINGATLLGSGNVTVSAGDPSYSQSSFTVATETWKLLGKRLKLTTAQRATLEGNGRLRLSN